MNQTNIEKLIQEKEELIKQELKKIEDLKTSMVKSIAKTALDEGQSFPVNIASISIKATKEALKGTLRKRLISEDELSADFIDLLVRLNSLYKCKYIVQKIEESFNTWSDKTKLYFSTFCKNSQTFYAFPFLNEFLLKFKIHANDVKNWKECYFSANGYILTQQCISLTFMFDNISHDKIDDATEQLLSLFKYGYKPDFLSCNNDKFLCFDFDKKEVSIKRTNYKGDFENFDYFEIKSKYFKSQIKEALTLLKEFHEKENEKEYDECHCH